MPTSKAFFFLAKKPSSQSHVDISTVLGETSKGELDDRRIKELASAGKNTGELYEGKGKNN